MATKQETTSGGIGVLGLLGVVFIVLKVTGYTKVAFWSWTWVLAPFWIPWAIVGTVLILIGFFALLSLLVTSLSK